MCKVFAQSKRFACVSLGEHRESTVVTINEVAKAAGVSISTVSYALSGKRSISRATRERIDRAIRELGYTPNAGARMLAGARTNILALSAPLHADGHLPTHMRFVTEVVRAARERDYDVLLLARDDEVTGIRRVASTSLVDGVVAMGVTERDERVALVRSLGVAAAFIGVPGDSDGVACVDLDFAEAARMAVERLVADGHRTIGVIGHPHGYVDRQQTFMARFEDGLAAAAAEAGVRIVHEWAEVSRGAGARAADALLDAVEPPTAIIFHCNEPAVEEAERRIRERGLAVPRDLSLFAAAASYDPGRLETPVTGITLPMEEMCTSAVEAALGLRGGTALATTRILAPELVDRGSTVAVA